MFWPAYKAIKKIFRHKLLFNYSYGAEFLQALHAYYRILIGHNWMIYPFQTDLPKKDSLSHTGTSPLEWNL